MPVFLFNFSWMLTNLFLAIVPIVMVLLWKKRLPPTLNLFVLFLWFLFLPNSIYLLSDLEHLQNDLTRTDLPEQIVLFFQYTILALFGIYSYLYSLQPLEQILKWAKIIKKNQVPFYALFHFIIAFGIVLGKSQRTHSWYIFTDPGRVLNDVYLTLTSPMLLFWFLSLE